MSNPQNETAKGAATPMAAVTALTNREHNGNYASTSAKASRTLYVELRDTLPPVRLCLRGRDAWAFIRLKEAGLQGCTPIDQPAPRWAAYVHKLRRFGLDVQTITEQHYGPYAGNHARYVLRSQAEILPEVAQ